MREYSYAALCATAYETYKTLLSTDGAVRTASARFILTEAERFVDAHTPQQQPATMGAAVDSLRVLELNWHHVRVGRFEGEELFRDEPGLWPRLMSEWPMGRYGEAVAELILQRRPMGELFLELGAGVGYTTQLMREAVKGTGVQIRATDLAYPGPYHLDFNNPFVDLLPQRPGLVYATNALHCAADPERSLSFIFDALTEGGRVVLGEGAPYPQENEPWALTALFGLFKGWYDGKGFRDLDYWAQALDSCGFIEVSVQPVSEDGFELGGVVDAVKG